MIPDKNAYLAAPNGYPSLDYAALRDELSKKLPFFTHLDVSPYLSLEDYYKTDTHWSQDKLGNAVAALADKMGFGDRLSGQYTAKKLNGFYGVYYGQAALPMPSESLVYLTNEVLEDCTVFDYATNKTYPLYREELFAKSEESKDPYNVFMGGASALPLLRIHNPNATTDKTLVLFRDSFGSSIAPLMAEGYSDVILVDLRYASYQSMLNVFPYALELDENTDVLFLYSTIILNNSYSFQ